MLTIEAVFVLNNSGVERKTKVFGCFNKAVCNIKVRNSRELDWGIFKGSVLKADCAGCNNDIAGLNIKVNSTAGSGANKGIGTAFVEFFHCNGSGRTANSG